MAKEAAKKEREKAKAKNKNKKKEEKVVAAAQDDDSQFQLSAHDPCPTDPRVCSLPAGPSVALT